LRKAFSLTGVVPIGAFLIAHLWTYSKALSGRQAFEASLRDSSPYSLVLEVVFVWLPIAFHAIYGVKLTFEARPKLASYPYSKNWMYVLQRVTGIVALAFIGWHFWQLRFRLLTGELAHEDVFPLLCAELSSTGPGGVPWIALAYLAGVAASAFHLANGLSGFCFSWGITRSRRATRWASAAFGLFGIVLFAIGANTVIYFATGSRIVLSTERIDPNQPPRLTCESPRRG
jgi:succinate dehydrogenase/fumarate reductase cytochrome b subunit (b558 family)